MPKILQQALLSLPQDQSVEQEKSKSFIISIKVLDNIALLDKVIFLFIALHKRNLIPCHHHRL